MVRILAINIIQEMREAKGMRTLKVNGTMKSVSYIPPAFHLECKERQSTVATVCPASCGQVLSLSRCTVLRELTFIQSLRSKILK